MSRMPPGEPHRRGLASVSKVPCRRVGALLATHQTPLVRELVLHHSDRTTSLLLAGVFCGSRIRDRKEDRVETRVVQANRRSGRAVGDPRRCAANSKRSGTQCKRFRTPGRRVCRFHGGKSLRGFSHPGLTHGRRSRDTMVRITLQATVSTDEQRRSDTPWTMGHPMEGDPQ
jgi:hypothetical protein